MKIISSEKINDGFNTTKFGILLVDGNIIEAVSFKKNNYTICLSSQVGCSACCKFCESGKDGLIRNLTKDELLKQYEIVKKEAGFTGHTGGYILFMGIGEPLLNYENVVKSIYDIKKKAEEKIIIATSGIIDKINKIVDDNLETDIAVSLHATDDIKRNEIMPISKVYNLSALLKAIYNFEKNGKRTLPIDINYLMFKNFNDSVEDAQRLVSYFKGKDIRIVLKDPCPIDGQKYFGTSQKAFDDFIKILKENNVAYYLSKSTGKEINAGCGQLRSKIMKK